MPGDHITDKCRISPEPAKTPSPRARPAMPAGPAAHPRFVITGKWLFHRRYSRDHQVLPGRRPRATVTAGPDAPAGTPAPARVWVVMGPITTFLRRGWTHHDKQVTAGQAFGPG